MNVWNPHNYLMHSGTKGMHWHERRYQNPDGTWTELGKERRRIGRRKVTGHKVEYARYKYKDDTNLADELDRASQYDSEDIQIMNSTYSNSSGKNAVLQAKQRVIDEFDSAKSRYDRYVSRHPDYNPDSNILQKYEDGGWDALTDDEADELDAKYGASIGFIDAKKECNFMLDELNSIPLKNNETTIGQDLSVVNPTNSRTNCPACSMSYILRRKGLDVSAGDLANGLTTEQILRYCTNRNEAHKRVNNLKGVYNSDSNVNSDGTHKRSYSELMSDHIISMLPNTNSSQYGMLDFAYTSGGGHIFSWEYVPSYGKVMFVDAQGFVNPSVFLESLGKDVVKDDFNLYINPEIDVNKALKNRIFVPSTGQKNPDFMR